MRTDQILDTFRRFYLDRGHAPVTGTSLVPRAGDPVLFTTSGMHPLTPFLLGEEHPGGRRLLNVQRCLRTTDLEEVGDATHLTCFQMLGTWSLGEYRGPLSLEWGYELLTGGFGIDPRRLHATVFGGDEHVGPDLESEETWTRLGVPVERTRDENWWSNGPTGPCGPDSEIFVWTGEGRPVGVPTSDERWVEVWNHVMMQHYRNEDGTLARLEQENVDTGMGLERLVMVLQGRPSVYETDLFEPWQQLRDLFGLDEGPWRLVSDHLRSSLVVVGDGVRPSNTGRGYVLRRLLRRSLTSMWQAEPGSSLRNLPGSLLEHTSETFGQALEPGAVLGVLSEEEERFRKVLRRGRPLVQRLLERGPLGPAEYSYLHETHGLPREVVESLVPDRGL